jgi:hypothetical protein
MTDLWTALEEHSRSWSPMDRQSLANKIWDLYVTARFARTGDVRALDYLYPYLNHADREVQLRAIRVVGTVFEGRGVRALDAVRYLTENPRHFLKDRAVTVVGATLKGTRLKLALPVLIPYLESGNTFTRKLALAALRAAAEGRASQEVVELIDTYAADFPGLQRRAIAQVFAGKPNEEIYSRLAGDVGDYENATQRSRHHAGSIATIVKGAGIEWFDRADKEMFDPFKDPDLGSKHPLWRGIWQREAVTGISQAGAGLGMAALSRMIHLAKRRCPGHAMLKRAPNCFVGADYDTNKPELIELIDGGDVPTQRVGAICLGRLAQDTGDQEVIDRLVTLTGSRNGAVRAAGLRAMGMVARSTCDERLTETCFDAIPKGECRRAAYEAIGDLYAGSGRSDIFRRLSGEARSLKSMPARRVANKSLAACYRAVGAVYRGTGSSDPFIYLVEILSLPEKQGHDVYRRAAAQALVDVEFAEAAPRILPRR